MDHHDGMDHPADDYDDLNHPLDHHELGDYDPDQPDLGDMVLDGPDWPGDPPRFDADHGGGVGGEFGGDGDELAAGFGANLPGAHPDGLSFVEDYADVHDAEIYHAGLAHPLDGYPADSLWPGFAGEMQVSAGDHLHEVAAGVGVPFGADPDLYPVADLDTQPGLDPEQGRYAGPGFDDGAGGAGDPFAGGWPQFPPALDVDIPEPVDGYPWVDEGVLGHDALPPIDDTTGAPDPADLLEYAAEQPPASGDAWAALLASDDPATSALARWWSTGP